MKLLLPRKDVLHAARLRWKMVSSDPAWRSLSYEARADLRDQYAEQMRKVTTILGDKSVAVYDLDPRLIAFAKKLLVRQIWTSYLIALPTVGFFFGLAGAVLFEGIAEWIYPPQGIIPEPRMSVVWTLPVAWVLMSAIPAVGLACARGAWRSRRLVQHVKRARKDPHYLLPAVDEGGE